MVSLLPAAMADPSDDDLDQLLDSALEDFNNIDLKPDNVRISSSGGGGDSVSGDRTEAAAPPAVQGLGLGLGLPDLKARKKGKQSMRGVTGSHASEALEKLRQQTREAVCGLESATAASARGGDAAALGIEAMVEEFAKQFEELAGSQDMESIAENMMQQLLSKELLHEPMKEIGEKYPKWLGEHKSGLSPEEYNRYHRQYKLIIQLNEVYEKEPDNFSMIVDLMQKMQECGQPPSDIIQELAPDLDVNNLNQLPPGLLESTSNCCVM